MQQRAVDLGGSDRKSSVASGRQFDRPCNKTNLYAKRLVRATSYD